MARLQGSFTPQDGGRWRVSLPVERGAKRRRELTFHDETSARRWCEDGIAAIETGRPLPDPAPYRRATGEGSPRVRPVLRTVRQAVYHWHQQNYEVLDRSQAKRRDQVRADIDNHLLPFLDGIGVIELDDLTAEVSAVVDILVAAELLPTQATETIQGPAEEVAARISCRAAALLAAELDPETDSHEVWASGYTPGDRALELLGTRASRLTEEQHAQIRGQTTPGDPISDVARENDEWTKLAAMMTVAHIEDGALDPPGTAEARLAARRHAWKLLKREADLPDRPPTPQTRVHPFDPALPYAARAGIAEVLRTWADWHNGDP